MFDAKADRERFGINAYALVVQHLEGVARTVADGKHDMRAVDLFAAGEHDAAQHVVLDEHIHNLGLEAELAAGLDDLLAQLLHHFHQPQCTDVRLADVQNFLGRTAVHKILEDAADVMTAILDAGVQLAVRKGPGTTLAELHIRRRVEAALAPETPHVFAYADARCDHVPESAA